MNDQIGRNLLDAAIVSAQKLHKKLRQLSNRGDASERDVSEARAALQTLRAIAGRHGLNATDIDSRGERRKP